MIVKGDVDAARQCYISRMLRETEPDGMWIFGTSIVICENGLISIDPPFDPALGISNNINYSDFIHFNVTNKSTIYRKDWEPLDSELASCCQPFIEKRKKKLLLNNNAWWLHCCDARHIATLYDVDWKEVYRARAAVDLLKQLEK